MNLRRIHASVINSRLCRIAAGLCVASFAPQAFALGLGEPSVSSVLGQPLQMTIPLVMDPGAELAPECVRIIPSNRDVDPTPTLNTGRLTIDAVGRKLRIESLQPVAEPTLRVAVELGCNERIRREFALLLDPPSVVAPTVNLAGAGAPVSSLGLGMAQISAVLGQRLSIKVPVVGSEAGNLTANCVRLADPTSSEGAPVLKQADIRVRPQEGGSLIEVATPDPVTEPAVRIALDVGCSDPLRREYAILLGMPTLAASNVDTTVATTAPAASESVPKPAPRRPIHKDASGVPTVPEPRHPGSAASRPAEPLGKAAPAPAAGPDRLVLGGSPQDSVGPVASAGDPHAILPDPSAELAKRMDEMSKQIAALQSQLAASHQHEQELERRAFETREQWTWSAGALGGLLLGGALVLAWRHRRPAAQATWEPVVTLPPQTTTAPRPLSSRSAVSRGARESSSEIGGRATMPPSSSMGGGGIPTEPSLTDERHTQITVTELHDTVQVIKELYATVLERNTAGAASSSAGKLPTPLDLDLRTPTRGASPGASPSTRPGKDRGEDQRPIDERFTELPTEVGLDLDLNTAVASAPELTDLLAAGDTGRVASRAQESAAASAAQSAAPIKEAEGAARSADAAAPVAHVARTEAAGRREISDDQLTQTPTEVSIDIDVGTATDFASTIGRSGPRTKASMESFDLQLDLSQPQTRSKRRSA
jgi:hypothetical protein